MTKFYVALATPSVELEVKAKEISGHAAKVLVGFKRYSAEEGFKKVDELNALAESPSFKSVEEKETAIKEFLKKEILYLKSVDVFTEEVLGTPVFYKTVEDTRTETDLDLQGENNNCLAFLLDMLFVSPSWGSSFTEAFYAVHMNLKLNSEAEIKN